MKARRAALNEVERTRAAQSSAEILRSWLQSRPENVIGVYLALPFELSLDMLLPLLWQDGRIVVAPRVEAQTNQMRFWRFDSLNELRSGRWNVREPSDNEELTPEIVLVPGLAYDFQGGRLGTGGGWYDRVLGDIPIKIGVCFDSLIVPHVPCEPHDIGVDWVASEERFVKTTSRGA